ncbi:MAG: hypothetical protein UFG06_05310 [Lachnospiraceae bacterium]|nr:hypothetical protein [Lachnospiraceae bacterium]
MDLRPINPYYRQGAQKGSRRLLRALETYTYPYTWTEPVTDRTQADVDRAKALIATDWQGMTAEQQAEYIAGLKGCLNRADLERIENNIQILLDVLEINAESHVGAVPEFPTSDYFTDMQNNVSAIREAYCIHEDTPQVPGLPYNTWRAFNAIEQILADVYEVVSAQFHHYAGGEIYAGEATGLLL